MTKAHAFILRSLALESFSLLLLLAVSSCSPPHNSLAGGSLIQNKTPKAQDAPPIALNTVSEEKYARPPSCSPHPGNPLTDFEEADFVGSGRCFACHHLLTDSGGNNVSIISHWRSTMMANAARDPFWQAKVRSEVSRNPAIAEVIEQKCATCHMPMAWMQSRAAGGYGKTVIFENGFLDGKHLLHQAAMDGVSCTLCHQIQDNGLGTMATFSGKFPVDTSTAPPGRILFGPYKDPLPEPMETSVGFSPRYGPQTNDSGLCATCHTLFTPYLDGQGNIAGEFPEQTPYLEWRHSDFFVPGESRYDIGENPGRGMICQECHMPHTPEGKVIIAKYAPPEVKPKDHFSQHFFVGGNAFMLDILRDNVARLGLTASSELFENTKVRTMDLLQNRSARISLQARRMEANILSTTIQVENMAGHKYPTGFPSRRLWIHLIVLDNTGREVFESGRPLPDGRIEGNDNDENIFSFEPHYTEISRTDQVQIYEAVMADTDGKVTYTLLRAAKYAKDNRLPPKGFDKSTAPAEIAVHGAASQDQDFGGGADQVTYRVDTSGFSGPFTITAELLYSPVSHAFVEDLRREEDVELIGRFMKLVDKANKMPVLIAAGASVIN